MYYMWVYLVEGLKCCVCQQPNTCRRSFMRVLSCVCVCVSEDIDAPTSRAADNSCGLKGGGTVSRKRRKRELIFGSFDVPGCLGCVLWSNMSPPNPERVWFFSSRILVFLFRFSFLVAILCSFQSVCWLRRFSAWAGLGWFRCVRVLFEPVGSASDIAAERPAVPVGAGSVVGW